MEAQIQGTQRKVMVHSVTPLAREHGDADIPISGGQTAGFRVTRSWSAPAGVYMERFYLIDPSTREVFYEGPEKEIAVWGLQSLTEVSDVVREPIPLTPGEWAIVFSLGGVAGGEFPVSAAEVSTVLS